MVSLTTYYRDTVTKNDTFTGGWATLYYGVLTKCIHDNNYKRVAEIGIGYGTHAKYILKSTDVIQLYLIDPTEYYPNDGFATDIMNCTPEIPGNQFNELFALIVHELSPWKDRYTWFRTCSLDITNDQIADGSLDCAFVDGNHTYDAVMKDLPFWWKKIRCGGKMLGDDYYMESVRNAAHDFAKNNNLQIELLSKENTDYKIFSFTKSYTCTLKEWQTQIKPIHTLLFNCSECKKCNDEWVSYPIGLSVHVINYTGNYEKTQLGDHSNTVLCAIHPTSDHRRRSQSDINRKTIIATLHKNNIQNCTYSISEYFEQLANYKFIISPEGNGIDCHRHYEAIMAGCIPIMEDNPAIREKYKGCPVVYTKDYSEITDEYLNTMYANMLETTYDFTSLFLESYSPTIRKEIIENGNYWGTRCYNKRWYDSLGITMDSAVKKCIHKDTLQ